jgi:hypothetical protein
LHLLWISRPIEPTVFAVEVNRGDTLRISALPVGGGYRCRIG